MNIFDIVLLVLLLVFGLAGLKKGFLKQVGKLIALGASIILAMLFYKKVAGYVAGIKFIANIEGKIFSWLSGKGELFTASLKDVGEEGLRAALGNLKLPEFIQNFVLNGLNLENLPDKSIAEFVSPLLFKYICYAIGFLLVYVIVWIAASIIVKVLTKTADVIPGLSLLNRLLGLAFGVLKVVLILCIVFYGLSFLSAVPSIADKVNEFMANKVLTGSICKFFYENNLIVIISNALTKSNAKDAVEAIRLFLK